MKSKKDAEITEKQLLDKFDYAWNKGSNGERRPDDIYRKLNHRAKESQFSLLAKKFLFVNKKQVGIKIRTCEPSSWKKGSNSSDTNNSKIFSRIFGIRRCQPTQMPDGSGDHCTDICGVAIGHGLVCNTPPVGGRKRCAIHKGLKVNGYISKLNTEGRNSGDFQDEKLSHSRENLHPCEHPSNENVGPSCGFILDDGSPCEREPVQRSKRCLEHKGRRISKSPLKFVREETEQIHARGDTTNLSEQTSDEKVGPNCGFMLEDGSACEKKPFQRNKRCLEG